MVYLVNTFQALIESVGNDDLIICPKIPFNVLKMGSLHQPDLINHIGLDYGWLIADLDQSAHSSCRANGVDVLFCIGISQHKHITWEEGNGAHLHLTMADGFLLKQRAIGRHALLLEVGHGLNFMLWLGLHHPPRFIADLICGLDIDTPFPLNVYGL